MLTAEGKLRHWSLRCSDRFVRLSAVKLRVMSDSISYGVPHGPMPGITSPQTVMSTPAQALRSPGGIGQRIAMAQATAGDNRGVHATVRGIAEVSGNDGLLADTSEVQCWENDFAEAVATARRIACADARCAALTNIGRIRLWNGDPDGAAQPIALALESAEAISDGSRRAPALAEIAEMQFDAIASCARA